MKISSKYTTITGISKFVALVMFVALPFIGFYFGTLYQKSLEIQVPSTEVSKNTFRKDTYEYRSIQVALEIYFSSYRKYPMTLEELSPTYLGTKPDVSVYTYTRISDTEYKLSVLRQDGTVFEISNP